MNIKFTVTGFETCTQPECDPAFVAKLFLRSECGKTLTLFPVPGANAKEEWNGKVFFLTDAAPDASTPAPTAKPAKKRKRSK